MELCFKEAARCILFFCDLHQPLFVFTTTTPRTKPPTSALSQLSLSVWGEIKFRSKWKIHLHSAADGHVNLISQHLVLYFFSLFCFHPQNLFKPLLLSASSTTPLWVILNPSSPLGFLLCSKSNCKVPSQRSAVSWNMPDLFRVEAFAQTPARRMSARVHVPWLPSRLHLMKRPSSLWLGFNGNDDGPLVARLQPKDFFDSSCTHFSPYVWAFRRCPAQMLCCSNGSLGNLNFSPWDQVLSALWKWNQHEIIR